MSKTGRSQFNGVLRACIEGLDVAVGSRDLVVGRPFNEGLFPQAWYSWSCLR